MSHRTQITLEDEQYERLVAESARSGRGLASLVRHALDLVYPDEATISLRLEGLEASFGSWQEDDGQDRANYLKDLRPGLGERVAHE